MAQAVQGLQQVARALVAVLGVADEEDAVRLLLDVVERAEDVGIGAVVDDLQLARRQVELLLDRRRGVVGAGDDAVEAAGGEVLHDPGEPEEGQRLAMDALHLEQAVAPVDGQRVMDAGHDGQAPSPS